MADSNALADLRSGLLAVDDVLSFAKPTVGKPSKKERSLFVASVALSYAVWENYVEEVAIEAVTAISGSLEPRSVPVSVRDAILKRSPTAWGLAVHPGWRVLWVEMVREAAKGGAENERDFGINTADTKNVMALFERVGVPAFEGVTNAEQKKLDKLVVQRGEIVHTGKVAEKFAKGDATAWRAFVEALSAKVDASVATGAQKLIGGSFW